MLQLSHSDGVRGLHPFDMVHAVQDQLSCTVLRSAKNPYCIRNHSAAHFSSSVYVTIDVVVNKQACVAEQSSYLHVLRGFRCSRLLTCTKPMGYNKTQGHYINILCNKMSNCCILQRSNFHIVVFSFPICFPFPLCDWTEHASWYLNHWLHPASHLYKVD